MTRKRYIISRTVENGERAITTTVDAPTMDEALMQDKAGRTLAELDAVALDRGELQVSGTASDAGTVSCIWLGGRRWPVVHAMSRTKRRDVVRLSSVDVYPGCTIHVYGFCWNRQSGKDS